jgi:hypothetical protein
MWRFRVMILGLDRRLARRYVLLRWCPLVVLRRVAWVHMVVKRRWVGALALERLRRSLVWLLSWGVRCPAGGLLRRGSLMVLGNILASLA